MNKHDRGIEEIVKRLEESPLTYYLKHHEVYGNKSNPTGEMDVVAYHCGKALIFEFKSNDNYKLKIHAIDQLHRARDYLKNNEIYLFYCYWDNHKVKYERIS